MRPAALDLPNSEAVVLGRVALTAAEERPPAMEPPPPHRVPATGEEMGERGPPAYTGTRLGQEPVLARVPSAPPSAMPLM